MPSSTRLIPKKLFKFKDYQSMPWKNGQGVTAQIDLQKDHDQPETAFLWRLSTATISHDNFFSPFPGMARLLVVWKGQGLWLNDHYLEPFKPFSFSGDSTVRCRCVGDEVRDLGLIYDPLKMKVQMTQINLHKSTDVVHFNEGLYFLFAAKNDFKIKDIVVAEGDSLRFEGPGEIELTLPEGSLAQIFLIHLQNKG